jgi:hypothetical protein
MGSSRNFLAVFSPIFLTADWPRFEWESVVAGDLNNPWRVLHAFKCRPTFARRSANIAAFAVALHPCTVTEFLARGKQGRRRWSNRRCSGGNKRRRKMVLNYGVIE